MSKQVRVILKFPSDLHVVCKIWYTWIWGMWVRIYYSQWGGTNALSVLLVPGAYNNFLY